MKNEELWWRLRREFEFQGRERLAVMVGMEWLAVANPQS